MKYKLRLGQDSAIFTVLHLSISRSNVLLIFANFLEFFGAMRNLLIVIGALLLYIYFFLSKDIFAHASCGT